MFGLFLMFPFALILFSSIAHICFSLPENCQNLTEAPNNIVLLTDSFWQVL